MKTDEASINLYSKARYRQIRRVTLIGSGLNLILSVLKIGVGILGKSRALIADGFHSLSDFSTDIAVIVGTSLASKPKDKTHDYGHGKYETLSTFLIGILLGIVGFFIAKNGIHIIIRAANGEVLQKPDTITVIIAVFSIVSKELLYRYTIKKGILLNSSALKANAVHHRTDAFSSVGTTLGITGAIVLGRKWIILDPIAAVAVGSLIVFAALRIIIKAVNELMESSLSDESEEEIIGIIGKVPGVHVPHNLKTRRIGNVIAIDVHIRIDQNLTIKQGHEIATNAEVAIKDRFGLDTIVNVHMEPYSGKPTAAN
ncbi:MAG: cation transporter [Spirochaetales bacterium]|nr:cation transporter [Spirochaetales bacterium]